MGKILGIAIKNYGSLKDIKMGQLYSGQTGVPLGNMVAIIGPSGNGKSTLADAFGFIADALTTDVESACDASNRGGYDKLVSQGSNGPIHFEDQSGAALIRILMQKIVELYPNATYDCKGFRGIGGFTRKNTIKETKTGKLLNDLATYLRGFDRSLQSFPSVIIVVLDSDDHDVQQFRSELEAVAMQNMIKIDHVFCLAVEEIEAWLLGDRHALLSAYPHAKIFITGNPITTLESKIE